MDESTKNLVSVILSAHNAEKYIGEAIESVLKQTYPYFELIVVDDGSTDKTSQIVKSFKDSRINLIVHSQNKGISEARNTALKFVKGLWFTSLDADDIWLPERLEKLMEIAIESGDDYFVADDLLLCFDTPRGIKQWGSLLKIDYGIKPDGKILKLSMSDYLKMGGPDIKPIIPLKQVKLFDLKYNPLFDGTEDFEFYCNLFRLGLKLKYMKKAFYLYRLTPGSITSKPHTSGELVLKSLSVNENFSIEDRSIFKNRLEKSKKKNQYVQFSYALKSKQWHKAFLLFYKNPLLFIQLLIHLPHSLRYRITAKIYGARIK